MNVCPKTAIQMKPDEFGFLYPEIDSGLCVECGACRRACGYQRPDGMSLPEKSYAATVKSDEMLKHSASGGVAALLSQCVVQSGGIVYGAALVDEDGKMVPKHVRVTEEADLEALQGSKYVQSDIGYVYREVKADLLAHRTVLFTGTPCQVAGLKAFLNADYDSLYTAEIICHGVSSARFFQDFIAAYEQKLGGHITRFLFRDKSKGQGMTARAEVAYASRPVREVVKAGETLSYICLFLKSHTYRENCYSCPYAQEKRTADLTLGDFWGFHEEYPRVTAQSGFSNSKGISCVLVNRERGQRLLEQCRTQLYIMETDFEKISRHNEQLCHPSSFSSQRNEILTLYRDGGYPKVEAYFQKNFRMERMKGRLSGILPKGLKRLLKRTVARGKNR